MEKELKDKTETMENMNIIKVSKEKKRCHFIGIRVGHLEGEVVLRVQ